MKARILVVDDEKSHRQMLNAVLSSENYAVSEADDGLEAVQAVNESFYDLILMDIRMGKMGGLDALKKIKEISPEIPVIIMTAYASVKTAVEALKSGAYDYITKPLDIDELKILVSKVLYHQKLEKENANLKERLDDRFDFRNIVGRSDPVSSLLETICMVAPTDATVLITGESGTGKELIANAIHQNSLRRDKPFIKVNCAALPESLLESELFGHEKGAFTGAVSRKQGRFELADSGSIFLDEIAEMTPATQAKILRVLQEKEFESVGGTETIKVNTRIIAATNKNLKTAILEDHFREDLYYRLNVVNLYVPALREHKDDIPLLSNFFLKKYSDKYNKIIKGIVPRALDLLVRYNWPGNIRELENTVERAIIMAREDMIMPEDFPETLRITNGGRNPDELDLGAGRSLKEAEREIIMRTLEKAEGNRTHAAEILGISRRTLQLKLKEYGIT